MQLEDEVLVDLVGICDDRIVTFSSRTDLWLGDRTQHDAAVAARGQGLCRALAGMPTRYR